MPWLPGRVPFDVRREQRLEERRIQRHAAAVAKRRKAKRGGKR